MKLGSVNPLKPFYDSAGLLESLFRWNQDLDILLPVIDEASTLQMVNKNYFTSLSTFRIAGTGFEHNNDLMIWKGFLAAIIYVCGFLKHTF